MQTWSGQNAERLSPSSRKFIVRILIVFSLAGLVVGFTVGGLTHSKPATINPGSLSQKPTLTPQVTVAITPTPTTPPVIFLNPPDSNVGPSATQSAAGSTHYTVTMQALDKQGKPVHSNNITCKIWLVTQIPTNQILTLDPKILKMVNKLDTPLTGMVNTTPYPELAYLNFDTSTNQTVNCDANGKATWKYTIAPTALPGDYDLVILADWKGSHYNWSWVNITIK